MATISLAEYQYTLSLDDSQYTQSMQSAESTADKMKTKMGCFGSMCGSQNQDLATLAREGR